MTRLLVALVITALSSGLASAQGTWPDRPIRLIVPFTPGSSSDIVARIVAQKVGERLKQQIIVDNRSGASGNMGTEAVARAEPDGYTIGLANTSTHAVTATRTQRLSTVTRSSERRHGSMLRRIGPMRANRSGTPVMSATM